MRRSKQHAPGHGFAVVANEVKELANQTATATDDIRQRIELIQSSTQDATSAIRGIREVVQDVRETSESIATSIEEQSNVANQVAHQVSETAITTDSLSTGISQSADASQEITTNIGKVDQVLQDTLQGAVHSASAGEDFVRLAAHMSDVVGQFCTEPENQDVQLASSLSDS